MTIRASNLTNRFNGHTVVNAVSLNMVKGAIVGLLGPNAVGKTTTIRMLCGILDRDEGQVRINGAPADQAKTEFGYVAQHFGQYEELAVWENLAFYAHMYNVTDKHRLSSLLDRYALAPLAGELCRECSVILKSSQHAILFNGHQCKMHSSRQAAFNR